MTVPGLQIDKAAQVILRSRYLVALVGAGMSVESGIPPFRGPGGLWTKRGEPDMRGYQRFLHDPKGWWEERLRPQDEMMADFRKAIDSAKPNPGHHALVELEKMGFLKYIITQNVDNLHFAAGSTKVAEIHGNTQKLRCISCNARFEKEEVSLDLLPPKCPNCKGIVKTDGVMFGEPIPADVLTVCEEQTWMCDSMLLLGTSAVVYPAAGFPMLAKQRGAYLIEVNPLETQLSEICDETLRGATGEVLPQLVDRIKIMKEDMA